MSESQQQAVEDKIRYEMDQKYKSKLDQLEQRSLYLDRSLELIEEMHCRFK
jgi:hypothetical protein